MEENESQSAGKQKSGGLPKIKLAALAAVIVGLFVLSRFIDIAGPIDALLERIENLGAVGAVAFILLYIIACILVIPGSLITLGGGSIYGLLMGFVLVSAGSTIGATAAFIIARYFARDYVTKKIGSNPSFKAMDDAVAQQGWKIVFLTRLTPVFPFSIQNYGYGLTKVPLPHYVLASWIGMMPGTVLYVYVGTLGGQAAEGGTTPVQWAMRIIALIATILVTIMITRIARNALAKAVDSEEIE